MKVYLALVNYCIYESADGVLSVHSTRQGANKAIKEDKRRYLLQLNRKAKVYERWTVKEMEVER